MDHIKLFRRATATVAICTMVTGCATQGGQSRQVSTGSNDNPCNVAGSAVGGALAGAAIGALLGGKKGAVAGAAIGGAAGAGLCLAYNSKSTQVKTASQSESDYKRANNNQLPSQPMVVAYSTQASTNRIQRGGDPVVISSDVELVNGTAEPVRTAREELSITMPNGEVMKAGSKPLTIAGAGRYNNTFTFKMPEQSPQGAYKATTTLYVNERVSQSRVINTQVALDSNNQPILVLAASN